MLWYRRDQSFLWLEIFRFKADTSSSSGDKKIYKKVKQKSASDDGGSMSNNTPYVSYINKTHPNTTHTTHPSSSPLSATNPTTDLSSDLYKPYEQVCKEILYWINTPRDVYIYTISHQIYAADILREMRKITSPKWGKLYERYMQEKDTNVIPESLLIKLNAVEPVQREYILRGIAERHDGEFPTAAFDLLASLTATPTTPTPATTPTPTTTPTSTIPAAATSYTTAPVMSTPHTAYTPPYTMPYTALDPFIRASESPTYTKQLIQYTQRINRVRLNTVLHTADICANELMQRLSNEVKSEYLDTSSIKRMLED